MKRCFAILLCLLSTSSFAGDVLTPVPMATGEWPPFVSASLPGQGSFVVALRKAMARKGLEPQLTFTSWSRAEHMVASGAVFAAFPYIHNTARAASNRFSAPVMYSHSVIFIRKEDAARLPRIERLDDIKGLRFASPRGYWYEDLLLKHGAQIVYSADETSAFKSLVSGLADAVIQNEEVGRYIIDHDFADQKAKLTESTQSIGERRQALMLMVSPTYPRASLLLRQINAGLATLTPADMQIQGDHRE
ncbi:MAG: transporter substrate-binding domain-containing protein [Burkholderiales bacterium]|nr:transporter substrate-binding domain-containing protein [Burkholderiales bacterium]